MASVATYRLRPGRFSDTSAIARVFHEANRTDNLFDLLYPNRQRLPENFVGELRCMFQLRYWTLDYILTVVVDEDDKPVGFSWWRVPASDVTWAQKWLSPYSWFASFMRGCLHIRDILFPVLHMQSPMSSAFYKVLDSIKPQIMITDRRRQALYLSTLAVKPSLQGRGLGDLLIRDGLQRADRQNRAAWLIGMMGTEKYYCRHDFAEVTRANIGELSAWNGGIVMFRE